MADSDIDAVLRLNAESVPLVGPLDADQLKRHREEAAYALVVDVDGQVAAFALAYLPGSSYGSINYGWHAARFDDFVYLDRITVGQDFRRRGIGTLLYDELEARAGEHGRMVCEVNSEPPNLESLAFHYGRGYRDVGTLRQADGHETVMLEKPLGPNAAVGPSDEEQLAARCAAVMWAEDRASQRLGMELVEVKPGAARLSMRVRDDMTNGHGTVHGGFIFALADSAFAFACNSHNERSVAQACDIVFAAPAHHGEVLTAVAVERHRFGRNGIYDVTVRCDDRVVAEFRGRSRTIGGTLVDAEQPPVAPEEPEG